MPQWIATPDALEARLSALKQLQERVQTQGKVVPWLKKHELESLPRLWQKVQVAEGWETALESALRERLGAGALQGDDVEQVQEAARQAGHPLQCVSEPVE
mgnify:CR=1 FL=1